MAVALLIGLWVWHEQGYDGFIISCLIASPLAWYFMQGWLDKYDYRIHIRPLVFVAAAVLAIVITLATVSWQAIRAAAANPIKSLRTE